MATSQGLDQFAKRMKKVGGDIPVNSAKLVRRAAIAADQVAVLATPVDTGRARGNWRVAIGAPDESFDEEAFDKVGVGAISEGRSVINKYKDEKSGPIYISNNVPYIVPLDTGSSAQAPNGMSSAAVQAARAILGNNDARLLEDR